MDPDLEDWIRTNFGESATPASVRAQLDGTKRTYHANFKARALRWVYVMEGRLELAALQAAIEGAEAARETARETKRIADLTKWAAIAASGSAFFALVTTILNSCSGA